ncbi:AMP-binding enzyme [Aspergillus eucalypticola CBS 122712]|uniref:AMP-binding enzyme n=1 Tax=Aspergillus eucalypticola (strain CBS 122712 / IBT 29274) TaxID=1448314 RepID=A0A317VDL2_ASPEC|nr:AMP-binding enzyme [Aspergillus eucalypticola CBS 122712]PWY71351.1 AMP-binding enzyme [Aspergillus eucalypticola CBS 122712]
MSLVQSRYSVNAPQTDLLSYLFRSPYTNEGAWPSSEPLLESAMKCDRSGYTIDLIRNILRAQGKQVIVYSEANLNFLLAILGVISAGATCNGLALVSVEELISRLRQLDCDIILFAPQDRKLVCVAAARLSIPSERLFMVDESFGGVNTEGSDDGAFRHWSHLLNTPGGDDYEWPRLSPAEARTTTAILLYTSGTTGSSKLAERTHYGLIGNIEQTLQHYNLQKRSRETIFIICGAARYKTIFPTKFESGTFMQTIERVKPTWLMLPKHLVRKLLAKFDKPSFPSVQHVLTGGAIIPYEMIDQWQRLDGSQMQSTYGMTEAGFYTLPDPTQVVGDATTGSLLPSLEAKISQKGHVHIRSPFAMKGYFKEPEQTAQTITDDGWIKTGDIGWVDERDQFYIVGRQKHLLKIKGENVSGAEIEQAILNHLDITDVAVIPIIRNEDEEPVPRGYIVKSKDPTLTRDELILAPIDEIPVSNVGKSKVDRRKLGELAEREL